MSETQINAGSIGGPSTQPQRGNNQLRMQLQAVHFAVNAWVIVSIFIYF
jgi:hypothetical protein